MGGLCWPTRGITVSMNLTAHRDHRLQHRPLDQPDPADARLFLENTAEHQEPIDTGIVHRKVVGPRPAEGLDHIEARA